MQTQGYLKHSDWAAVYAIVGGAIICFGLILLNFGFNEASIRMNIRWSARFSIICFCLAFGASAFNSIFDNSFSRWLIKYRRYLGVSFGLIHLIHLLFLMVLHQNFHQVFILRPAFEIALGGLAYLFLILMLFTSFELFSKKISKLNWKYLHKIGGYWILIVFSNSMLGRVAAGNLEYLPFGILVLSVWLIRFLAWRLNTTV